MQRYLEAAWERAMKVQEVILRAMAKRMTWWQAAEILGISVRSMRRWRWRYEHYGYDGLFDRRRGRPIRTEPSESCCRSSKVLAAGRALEDEANGWELFELELRETNGRQCGLMRTQIPSSNEPWTPLFNPSPGPVSKLCQKSM